MTNDALPTKGLKIVRGMGVWGQICFYLDT